LAFLESAAAGLVIVGVLFFLYTYIAYPLLLGAVGLVRPKRPPPDHPGDTEWPRVSIMVPAFNEEHQIEGAVRCLLSLDYPKELLEILVVSDGSTDRTEEIVSTFAKDGVELLRMPERGGKTKAENAAAARLKGDIIVTTDASIRLARESLRFLVARFADPEVGLASGRDVSVSNAEESGNVGESGYVDYEMAVRSLETRVSGIVGASGSLYAVRPELQRVQLPDHLSRDFAAALLVREAGLRGVSVPDAICYVPRTSSLTNEYRRKLRTITRGMETLAHKKNLLNPLRYPLFSWMLFSHKVCRWLLPWFGLFALLGLAILSAFHAWALSLFSGAIIVFSLALVGFLQRHRPNLPRVFALPAFIVLGNLAAAHALVRFFSGEETPIWEPTRRGPVERGDGTFPA